MAFVLLTVITFSLFAQCDNTLRPSDNPAITYQIRGNRCEGVYVAKVGAPSLDLVGFTVGEFSYKLDKSEIIKIENRFSSNIFIRASAIPLNTYYRMDASIDKNKIFNWEIKDVLYPLNIPSNALGVYGWSGTEQEKLFWPVKPVSSVTSQTDNKLYLIIRTSSKLMEVRYRYAEKGGYFSTYESVKGQGKGGQGIVIVLPETLKGDYTIEVAAMLESKAEWVKNQYQLSIK